jgi:tRNA G37 N-methylase Trm5
LDKVEIICGDAHDVVRRLCKEYITADRVIMNLPFSAHQFFSDALSIIIDRGIIHYYDILN